MFLPNHLLKDLIAVLCILGTTACTSNQSRTDIAVFRPVKNLDNVQPQVILNAEKEYEIALQQGDLAQICAQAELVATSYLYLQSYNSEAYRLWKAIEKQDCDRFQAEESLTIKAQTIQNMGQLKAVMEQPVD
ncbi:hypothetical protein [Synechococcus elongatus]|uniref:hypothetical protein n=1 Tax=Synechococcus elongatus TaxID=32046 RepID=UPI00351BB063